MAKRGPQYSQKERLVVVKEGEKNGVKAVCAKYGISTQSYRTWRYRVHGIRLRKQLGLLSSANLNPLTAKARELASLRLRP